MLFKPYTHVEIGKDVLADVQDGMITIEGQQFAVDSEVAAALQNHPDFYTAGVIGPDGFPDLIMGQSVIHPVNTGRWLQHALDSAWAAQSSPSYSAPEKSEILAWSYGFLTHAAEDMWAHTLVNEFAQGVFPAVADILTDSENAAIAVRHLLVEGYIGDATPGYDGNPDRTTLPDGDVSDDSTPGIDFPTNGEFQGMSRYIYQTFILPQDPAKGLPTSRGPVIDFFLDLRAGLEDAISGPVNPIENAVGNFNSTVDALEATLNSGDCNFDGFLDSIHDAVACPLALGTDIAIGAFTAAEEFVEDSITAAFGVLLNAYLGAWIDDIDSGLEAWGEGIGLRSTRALFDPQARRNMQNSECASEGPENEADRAACEDGIGIVDVLLFEIDTPDAPFDSFVNNHLLSMLGAPDFVGGLRAVLTEFGNIVSDVLEPLLAPIEEVVGVALNPLEQALDELEDYAKDLVKSEIRERFGIDVDQIQDFFDRPSSKLGLAAVGLGGIGTIDMFQAGDRAKLDAYLGITGDPLTTHNPLGSADILPGFIFHAGAVGGLKDDVTFSKSQFAAYANSVALSKLLLLDGQGLDNLISQFNGIPYQLASPEGKSGNVMTTAFPGVVDAALPTNPAEHSNADDVNAVHPANPQDLSQWLRLIDGDHAWRANGQPVFPLDGQPAYASAGNGNFPLWESCLTRGSVFRTVFVDWENGGQSFPDLGDGTSHDPNEVPPTVSFNPATGILTIVGTPGDDFLELQVFTDAGGNQFVRLEFPDGAGYCANQIDTPLADVQQVVISALAGNDTVLTGPTLPVDVEVNGDGDNDTLLAEYTGGLTRTIEFHGGPGDDLIQLTGGGATFSGVYDVGFHADDGTIAYQDGVGNVQFIAFTGLEPINDLMVASSLTINASEKPDTINVTSGPLVLATQTTLVDFAGAHEEIRAANKHAINLNARGREDRLRVDLPLAGAELASLNIDGGNGDDLFAVTPYPIDVQINVVGNLPNASDQLLVVDTGKGDLILHREGPDGRSGSIQVGPVLPIGYEGVEKVSVAPLNPLTSGTGADGLGRVVVLDSDPFEHNDSRLTFTDFNALENSLVWPTIDPPALTNPFAIGVNLPGDEDWYRWIAPKTGTFRFQLDFQPIGTLSNGQPGLPGDGNLEIALFDAAGVAVSKNVGDGAAAQTIGVQAGAALFLRVKGATGIEVNRYNVRLAELDLVGPQITGLGITGSSFDLFDPKPLTNGPTPLVTSLTVSLRDLPLRAPGDIYPALDALAAGEDGHYRLIGDHNGIIPISAIAVTNNPGAVGELATATIVLQFAQPLPDDRYTLTIFDTLFDPAGNRLDGDNNAAEPQESPLFPTGDGVAGGDFVARFTVDSRPEIGTYLNGAVHIDINGNGYWDPTGNNNDYTNRDLAFAFASRQAKLIAGNFAPAGAAFATGFDKLAAYDQARWVFDFDHNGTADLNVVSGVQGNGDPIVGNWSAAHPGDEIGLFTGQKWYLDAGGNNNIADANDLTINAGFGGTAFAGDFDGDGKDDLATYKDGLFTFDLAHDGLDGKADANINFSFFGPFERPLAADLNRDGIDDIGLFITERSGPPSSEVADWYWLISTGVPVAGSVSTLNHPFSPVPLGKDQFFQFGDVLALPIVGNFDPPIEPALTEAQNPLEPLDVNRDGAISPLDALLIFNQLNAEGGHEIPVPMLGPSGEVWSLDVSGDSYVSALDALMIFNHLNAQPSDSPEGESASPEMGNLLWLLSEDQLSLAQRRRR